jgi:hypothetical protein
VPPSKSMDLEPAIISSGFAAAEGGGEGWIYTVEAARGSKGAVVSPVPMEGGEVADVSGATAGVLIIVEIVEGDRSDETDEGPSPNESHPPIGMVFMWHNFGNFTQRSTPPEFWTEKPDELDGLDKLDELGVGEIGKVEGAVRANWS